MPVKHSRLAAEAPVLAAVLLDMLGFGMVLVDFQFRAERLGAGGLAIGLLLGSTFAVQVLVSARWGALSDRIGRKPVFVACTLLSAGSNFAYGFAGSLWGLAFSRVLAGLGGANFAVGQAYNAEQAGHGGRLGSLGRIGAALTLGLMLGPLIGGQLWLVGGSQALGYSAGVCSLVAALIGQMLMKRSRPSASVERPESVGMGLGLLREVRPLRALALIVATSWLSLAMLQGTFGRLIERTLGYGQREFGLVFAFESLVALLVQAFGLAWIASRASHSLLVASGFGLQAVGLGLTPYAPGIGALLLAGGLYSLGKAVTDPALTSQASGLTPEARQGELFGMLNAARSVGFIFGPALGGVVFDWRPSAAYLIAAGVCVVAATASPLVTRATAAGSGSPGSPSPGS